MIAEHRVDRRRHARAQRCNAFHGLFDRAIGLPAIVTGQHADVVSQAADDLEQMPHGALAEVDMQIADVKDGEPVKCRRQVAKPGMVALEENVVGISAGALVETGDLQRLPDDGPRRIPVLEMEEGAALAEDLGFMIRLELKPRPCLRRPEPLFQLAQDLGIHRSGSSALREQA